MRVLRLTASRRRALSRGSARLRLAVKRLIGNGSLPMRYRLRQNEGMNKTRIAKISMRPIIISQTNKIFVGELKWP